MPIDHTPVAPELEQRLATLEAELAELRARPRTRRRRWALAAVALGLLITSTTLAALTDAELGCTEGSGLTCFRPGEAARATDVNVNFSRLWTSLDEKTGQTDHSIAQLSAALETKIGGRAEDGIVVNGPTVLRGSVTMPASLLTASGTFYASMHDRTARADTPMTRTGRSFCFLTRTAQADLNLPNEVTSCLISASDGTWFLSAELAATNDANVWCEARCISW